MIYKPFSIVVVPFPFTDKAVIKKRPALVISQTARQNDSKHVTLLMITSAKQSTWPSDHMIKDLNATGLSSPSIVRQKIFTLDNQLILHALGHLAKTDREVVLKKLQKHLAISRQ